MTDAVNNTLLMAQFSSLDGYSAPTSMRASHVSDIMQYGCAAVTILLLTLLFMVIGLMIKLTSRGPILNRGLRVGKDGRIFTMYEFRTLRADAEEKIGAPLLTDRDANYTRIGRLLKRTKLDQLPQLVNVLKGDMNFVGPRPVRPLFLQQLGGDVPRLPVRLTVKPGIMGSALEDDRYCIDPNVTRRDELPHINLRSPLLALKLIALKIAAAPKEFSSFFKGLLS